MALINFFTEQIKFSPPKPRKTVSWIKATIKKEKATLESINYIFCTDEYLLQLNVQYLKHNTLTDIITFNYGHEKVIEGDIYISIDRIRENAEKFHTDFNTELRRVLIHGVLHLIGYKDKSKTEKALMRKKEDTYLSLWG